MRKHQLTAACIKAAPNGRLYDGAGLFLVKAGTTGKWVYRYSHLGRRRDMGLGQWPQLSLASARAARDRWEAMLAEGKDPMDVRQQARDAEMASRAKPPATLSDVIAAVFDARKEGLRGEGERGRWLSPLKTHVEPKLGDRPVCQLTRHAIADVLRPIWRKKHPTAIKAISRLHIVLQEGKFMGYDCDPFEAQAAERILGEYHHVATPIPAVPWRDLPALYQSLDYSTAAECLRWMILTVVREDGCTGARLDEIKGDVWTVPKDRIKGRVSEVQDFRVPLSAEALKVLERVQDNGSPWLFSRTGIGPIHGHYVDRLLNRMGVEGRPHGMRSAFKDWTQDTRSCPWEVSEVALGHTLGTRVSRHYARSDLLDLRRPAMESWSHFLTGAKSNVIRIRR